MRFPEIEELLAQRDGKAGRPIDMERFSDECQAAIAAVDFLNSERNGALEEFMGIPFAEAVKAVTLHKRAKKEREAP